MVLNWFFVTMLLAFVSLHISQEGRLMADYYRVYTNSKERVVSAKEAVSHFFVEDPKYDTIFKFFHSNLVIGCVGLFHNGNTELVYHPGQTKDNIMGLIKVGMVISTYASLYNKSSKLSNMSRFTQEEEAIYNRELANLRMSAIRSGKSVPNNISSFVQHFKDAKKFPVEGYYSDPYSSSPDLQATGQIHRGNLYSLTYTDLKELGLV